MLIPPWQQPDEHAHVAISEVHNLSPDADVADPARQTEILRSMAEHGWWRHRTGEEPPSPLPTRFGLADVKETIGINPLSRDYPRGYYGVMGRVLALGGRHAIVRDLYVMRGISMVFALATLWMAWLGARVAIGDAGAGVVTLLLALHPQFAVVSTTASPDAVVNFAGACLWWQAMRAITVPKPEWPLAAVWIIAAVITTVDRMGVPLVMIAFLLSVFVVARRWGFTKRTWVATIAGAILVAAILWLLNAASRTFTAVAWQTLLPVPKARTAEFFTSFVTVLFRSWWFSAGWVRYVPPVWWTLGAVVLAVTSVAGLLQRFSPARVEPSRIVAAVAALMLAVQLGAVYWTYFRLGIGPQGRHLFPCLVPALVLLWLGAEAWVPEHARMRVAAGLVLTFAALDATAWLLVAMPAYAR